MKPKIVHPSGILCKCGCGFETLNYNGTKRKFIYSHHSRGAHNPNWHGGKQYVGKYILLWLPNHPRASKRGCVMEHIVVAEKILGRSLYPNEVVHHKDQNGHNNNPNNLEIMDRGLHTIHHRTGAKNPQYTKEGLLVHLAKLLPITITTYRKQYKYPSHETYRLYFGSWSNAVNLASKLSQ